MAQEKPVGKEIKQMVRLFDRDVDGSKRVFMALREVKGVGLTLSHAVCSILKLNEQVKIGEIPEEDLRKVEDVLKNPSKHGIPAWLLNRQNDFETGEDKHLVTSDLKLAVEDDIKRMKMIRTYKGIRHSMGQPVRGQRTKAHFRKGASLGVARAKKPAEAAKK